MSTSALRNHPAFQELNTNKRLQWLLLIIVGMLCASGLKALSDKNDEIVAEIQTQQRLLNRLDAAAKMELTEQQVEERVNQANELLAKIPDAPSLSVAEANALSRIESLSSNLQRARSSLVGSEILEVSNNTMWQVRVEVQGQLDDKHFASFLEKVDGHDPTLRVVSFRYKPGNRGTFATVIDFIFKQAKQ